MENYRNIVITSQGSIREYVFATQSLSLYEDGKRKNIFLENPQALLTCILNGNADEYEGERIVSDCKSRKMSRRVLRDSKRNITTVIETNFRSPFLVSKRN